MLWPVASAPVNADDRYWYLRVGHTSGGSYPGIFEWTYDELPAASQSGRLAPFASVSRRLVGLAVMQFALATATPVVVLQAVVKLVTFGLGIGACLAFLRSLRRRGAGGELVRISGRTLAFVGAATALLTAAGSQAHSQFRNGWTSYAVLTWGSVVVVFGLVALALWLLRKVAARPRVATGPAVLVLVVAAVFLNFSYELVYITAPAVLLALLLQPVGTPGDRWGHWRPKLVVGSSFLGAFAITFVSLRVWLAGVCERNDCYTGVEPQLTVGALRTMAYNLVGAIPVAGGNELRADLERVGLGDRYPVPVTAWSIALAVVAAASLLALWWGTRPRSVSKVADLAEPAGRRTPGAEAADRRAQGLVLLGAALVAVAVAVGEAVVMGLSVQAEEIVTQPGLPYRHTMITWTGLAFALVCVCVAAHHLLGRSSLAQRVVGALGAGVLAIAVGAGAAVVTPQNAAATTANRLDPRLLASETLQWEVVLGDRTPEGDDRRCAVLDRVRETLGDNPTTDSIVRDAERAFVFHHGMSFCSTDGG